MSEPKPTGNGAIDENPLPLVLTETHGQIFEITLNRPEKRNAINWPLMQALSDAIDQAEQTPGVRAILLYGNGPVFSSGIDLVAFPELASTFGENWRERMMSVTAAFQSVFTQLERCTLPTIALLRGFVLGLGMELALACDFRIVARHTKIAMPEARLGLLPDVGGTTRLTRLVGPSRAKEILMTGDAINLENAERWGLVNAVVPASELKEAGETLAAQIAQSAPMAVKYIKRVVDGLADIDRGLQLEAMALNHLIQTDDFMIGIQSMMTKTPPEWTGK